MIGETGIFGGWSDSDAEAQVRAMTDADLRDKIKEVEFRRVERARDKNHPIYVRNRNGILVLAKRGSPEAGFRRDSENYNLLTKM